MAHQDRISTQQAAFTAAMQTFEDTLARLSDEAAGRTSPDGGWSPAQIAWHVGQTNELLAGVLTGQVPLASPAPDGFTENPNVWSGVPAKVQTFPQLVPPDVMSRDEALSKLRDSAQPYLQALQSLTPERAGGHCVDFPFGKLSLYQLAEFTAAHVARHQAQLERAVAGA